ncbi:MAG: helix-turn-helix domain-containing protein [Henriciella sp.]
MSRHGVERMEAINHAQIAPGSPVYKSMSSGNLDFWIAACGNLFGIIPLNQQDAEKEYSTVSCHVAPITISRSKYCGMVNHHSRWHVEEIGGLIHVYRLKQGFSALDADGTAIEGHPGNITLLDFSRPFSALHKDNVCEGIFVPHSAIHYQASDACHALVYLANSSLGRLLTREMDFLFGALDDGATFIDPQDVDRFLGCVELAMSPQTANESARAQARDSLKRAIQDFVELRLDDPDLCVSLILHNFGVSRASLYRMFETEDGVRNYIRRRRLHRAVTDLALTPHTYGKIHQVSERWGFSSGASFNRMVKREFGVAPGGLFQLPISDWVEPHSLSSVHRLMRQAARRTLLDA